MKRHLFTISLTENQARSLALYIGICSAHAAGRLVAKDMRAIHAKLARKLAKVRPPSTTADPK